MDVLRSLHDWGGEELGGGGGGVDGGGKEKGIWCHRVEVRVLENHQNGKDTHVRGIQIFSLADEKGVKRGVWGGEEEEGTESGDVSMDEDREGDGGGGGGGGGEVAVGKGKSLLDRQGWGGMDEPDWMRDPVIR